MNRRALAVLSVAAALAPSVSVLDEPFRGRDIEEREPSILPSRMREIEEKVSLDKIRRAAAKRERRARGRKAK